jgi:glycosyltransferase involved in cell wall biosynthesis
VIPIAFYAPLKSPRHPNPSGDRTMARLLMAALRQAGFAPHLASEIRALDVQGEPVVQGEIRRRALAEAHSLAGRYLALPAEARPRLFFTYHVYYKAPDWIGPAVADALDIPYVIAEGSRAAKRAHGPFALGHRGAEAALDRADVVLILARQDREALAAARPPGQTLVDLPPFLDPDWIAKAAERAPADPPALVAVAMMRPGDKLASYALLAEALARVAPLPWTLAVVGDGPARPAVENLFRPFGPRVAFHGALDPAALRDVLDRSDLCLWPAVNEAYGMVLLEAQARGCPVLAGAEGGVPGILVDGVTGVLAPPRDAAAFAACLARLLQDGEARRRLGRAARDFVASERTTLQAAERLRAVLVPLAARAAA